ncbi:MAG: 4Fe-4S binding protein [Bacteroidales bacterium]|nr:4Fe-4S binding protein [Bacteroidales bacterium]
MGQRVKILLFGIFIILSQVMAAQQRFPKPEFETGYVQPSPTTPEPRGLAMEYMDVLVLLAVLSLATWFALRSRSRRGILWLSVFTLVYFGFYRKGCICSIGAIQNVALSLSDAAYSISITALAFFLLPLLFALFFGRTFCAGACPLGAIQDLLIIKPISLPPWLRKTAGIIPVIYLGLAVLFAVTGSEFIICRYDPFVGIFRLDAPYHMVVLGISFLLLGMFVARPYCRFFCPYGVLLNWMSRFSKWHLRITPSDCIRCKLCTSSCPFDAIDHPTEEKNPDPARRNYRKFIIYFLLIPLWVLMGGFIASKSYNYLSRVHQDVYLSELLINHPELVNDPDNLDIQIFLSSGKTLDSLVEEARIIQQKFRTGGWIMGGFIGLVIGITLLNQVVFRKREDYQPDRGDCFSCGRCMDYCPVKN